MSLSNSDVCRRLVRKHCTHPFKTKHISPHNDAVWQRPVCNLQLVDGHNSQFKRDLGRQAGQALNNSIFSNRRHHQRRRGGLLLINIILRKDLEVGQAHLPQTKHLLILLASSKVARIRRIVSLWLHPNKAHPSFQTLRSLLLEPSQQRRLVHLPDHGQPKSTPRNQCQRHRQDRMWLIILRLVQHHSFLPHRLCNQSVRLILCPLRRPRIGDNTLCLPLQGQAGRS